MGSPDLWECKGFRLARFEGLEVKRRDKLVSTLLQDRGALRILSAPRGFGKSVLAYEYAQRLFPQGNVVWIDASMPDFLQALDAGFLIPDPSQREDLPGLLVIDDIPYLDEERSRALSAHIDMFIYQGAEVLVTCVPSHDTLKGLQPDRVLVGSADLFVTEWEFSYTVAGEPEARRAAAETWDRAQTALAGLVPGAVWGCLEAAQWECLMGFLTERLPLDVTRAALAMLLMGEGCFDDLDRLGLGMRSEDEAVLIKSYPFFGVEPIQRTFSVPVLSMGLLARAVAESGKAEHLSSGIFPLSEKVLSLLLERGSIQRAEQVLDHFCSDDRCAAWLKGSGWDLVDRLELKLVEKLMARCPFRVLNEDAELQALAAWCSGLQGDSREALHYAARSTALAGSQEDVGDMARVMGHLASLAFGSPEVDEHAQLNGSEGLVTDPASFLAAVVANCTNIELMRACSFFGTARSRALEAHRQPPDRQRCDLLMGLFTGFYDRFAQTPSYRLALHILQSVDSPDLRTLLVDLACPAAVNARRNGVHGLTDALLMGDLWRDGFFGLAGSGTDSRDARILNEAAVVLRKAQSALAAGEVPIPWEQGRMKGAPLPQPQQELPIGDAKRIKVDSKVPPLHVRLFGGFEVAMGDTLILESSWRRKPLLLFSLLVIGQGRDMTRDYIKRQLWPGSSGKRAMDNFYTTWARAARMLGEGPYMERAGEFCRINHRLVTSDVAEYEQLVRRMHMERGDTSALLDVYARIEAIYKGVLLPGETVTPLILEQRERYSTLYADAMVAASQKALEAKDVRVGLWFAQKAMEEDSKREDVYHALMSAQIAAGQRCSAIRTFLECRHFLSEELGLDPSSEVQGLYSKLIESDPSLLRLESTVALP